MGPFGFPSCHFYPSFSRPIFVMHFAVKHLYLHMPLPQLPDPEKWTCIRVLAWLISESSVNARKLPRARTRSTVFDVMAYSAMAMPQSTHEEMLSALLCPSTRGIMIAGSVGLLDTLRQFNVPLRCKYTLTNGECYQLTSNCSCLEKSDV